MNNIFKFGMLIVACLAVFVLFQFVQDSKEDKRIKRMQHQSDTIGKEIDALNRYIELIEKK